MGKQRLFSVLGHLTLIFHYCLEISLHLLMHIFFQHMLSVFLLCYCSFSPFPGKQQQSLMAEWSSPPADHLQPLCKSCPSSGSTHPIVFCLCCQCCGQDGRARVMGEESDAGLTNMPDPKQRGQWEHSFPRTWIILLVINKRRN